MKTIYSKPQTPAKSASVFKSVIADLKKPGLWPLDTIVNIGQHFGGPSQNDGSSPAHTNFQNLSNSSKKIENEIRDLCTKTFEKYIWKLEKVRFDCLKISKIEFSILKKYFNHFYRKSFPGLVK